jgi:hypothetical protein
MIEAMKQTLEALEDFVDVIKYDNEQDDIGRRACCDVLSYNPHSESCKAKQAITAIKAALAQPAPVQEPVGYVAENGVVDWNVCVPPILTDLYTRPPQRTEQNFCPRCGKRTNDIHTCTPPQRTWVGLTNEELTDLFYNTNLGQQSAVSQAVALLKERNS